MSDYVIRVENLSKCYRINAARPSEPTFREMLAHTAKAPLHAVTRRMRRAGQPEDASDKIFWALKNVSFEVKAGEVIGVIGRNGAGKSTLLKILSRITKPTDGYARIRGRVGSLLEVGTGFHPELSGRENVYLSGALLGMRRNEIARKFDEILAFAEVEKFVDTPVKHYSSGMYLRLAFAIAAHLEPEILLVDEVLAVGDAAFQKKCLGKMGDVAREGRTILYVSHHLGALANLCPRAILLVGGEKVADDESNRVISQYITLGNENQGEKVWTDPKTAPASETVRLSAVRLISGGECTTEMDIQKDIQVEVEFTTLKSDAHLGVGMHLFDKLGVTVLASANFHSVNLGHDEWFGRPFPIGSFRTVCTIPGNFLNEGRYTLTVLVLNQITRLEAYAPEILSFIVHDTGAMRAEFGGTWVGVVRPKLAWETSLLDIEPLRDSRVFST